MRSFNEHMNLNYDKEQDIQMNPKTYEENGNNLDLNLLTVSY